MSIQALKSILRYLVLTFLAGFFLSQPILAQDLVQLVKQVRPATVKIYSSSVTGEKSLGSGFFINDKGEVVTNYHVIKYKTHDIEVETDNKKLYPVKYIIASDVNADIAILKVNIPRSPAFLKISGKLPEVGERIIVLGSPKGLAQTVSEGIVSAIRDIPAGLNQIQEKGIQITAPISPGSSGGPVINFQGEAIGVVKTYMPGGENLGLAIPGSRVLQVVELGKKNIMTDRDMEKLEEMVRRARKLDNDGNYEEALKIAKEIINQYPTDFRGYFRAGMASSGMNKFSEAETYYRKAIDRNPTHSNAHNNLGLALFFKEKTSSNTSKNKFNEAFQCWERSIQLDQSNPHPYFSMAFATLQLGDVKTSVKYAMMLRQYDTSGKLYQSLMEEFKRKGVSIKGN
ncbi:MAG: trypsin-like peptidase domain-containing protein [Thermodesulfobacteriota bacterium]